MNMPWYVWALEASLGFIFLLVVSRTAIDIHRRGAGCRHHYVYTGGCRHHYVYTGRLSDGGCQWVCTKCSQWLSIHGKKAHINTY
jgi:hypothetical protein